MMPAGVIIEAFMRTAVVSFLCFPVTLLLAIGCGGGGTNNPGTGGAGGGGDGGGGGGAGEPPAIPVLTGPSNGATGEALEDTYLNWEDSAGAATYDVYFGVEADPPLVATGLMVSNHNPGDLEQFTTYHWKVAAVNEAGSREGAVWSFATGATVRPIAAFDASLTSGDAPLTVSFTDASQGVVEAWAWDLDGDGTIDSSAQNPAFTYTEPGRYDVTLTAIGGGDTDVHSEPAWVSVFLVPCDFWIDAEHGAADGPGTRDQPYLTITRALSDHPETGLTFQVMSGRYDSALGESFPLVLGEGQRLIGDVANRGLGINPVEVIDDSGVTPVVATGVIVGAADAVVAGLAISAAVTVANHYGVTLVAGVANAEVRDNTLSAPLFGGVYVDTADPNTIADNGFATAALGVAVVGGPPEILRNDFVNPSGFFDGAVNCGQGTGPVTPRIRNNLFAGQAGVVVPVVDDVYDFDAAPDLGVVGDPGGNNFAGVPVAALSHGSKAMISARGNFWPDGDPVLGRDILVLDGGQVEWGDAGQIYPASPSLLAHLGFYYASAADQSGNGYNGANFGATAVADRRGIAEYAMAFNTEAGHTEDYIALLGSGSVSLSELTLVAIVSYPAIDAGDSEANTIASKTSTGQDHGTFSLFTDDLGVSAGLHCGMGAAAGVVGPADPDQTAAADTWYHVAVSFAADPASPGDGFRYEYLAGQDVSAADPAVVDILPGNLGTIMVGRRDDDAAPEYFEGVVDDLRIYDRALSAQEVQRLYVDSQR